MSTPHKQINNGPDGLRLTRCNGDHWPEITIFGAMQLAKGSRVLVENITIESASLERPVMVDCFLPDNIADASRLSLLLINDGQNMAELGLATMLDDLLANNEIEPLCCVAIHAGTERKMEYGVASQPDFKGRGAKAGQYSRFILEELIPFLQTKYLIPSFRERSFAGFSLGGLTALDIVLSHPNLFSKAGVFSGSLWWRSVDQTDPSYKDDQHRIIHQVVRKGKFHPGLQFFFQCGNMDETRDRNGNGIIDSIDDTLDLIKELEAKGYKKGRDIFYLEMPDGQHDIASWARAMPLFLKWGWPLRPPALS